MKRLAASVGRYNVWCLAKDTAKYSIWCGALCGLTLNATAQTLPSEPVTFGGGRIVLGGDAAVSVGPPDPGFFNYSDYEHSTLREFRIGVTAAVRATERVSFLGALRSENLGHASPFALYARVRPFPNRRFDVQVGRIPPTFGAFTRRAYGSDNPLIGYPLAYQYLTSLRADTVPASADELLRMRGRGWLSNFSIGNRAPNRGVPLVTAFSWDTGVQVSTGWRRVDVAAAITNGTASNPRVKDDNAGKQLAARVAVRPVTALVIGSSFSRGQFLDRHVLETINAPDSRAFTQQAIGLDGEYSHAHLVVRGDAVVSGWQLPLAAEPLTHGALKALALALEARYTFMPGAYGAVRAERLSFNRIEGSTGVATPWEAPVTRVEVGGGYYLQRNLVARVSLQDDRRDAGRVRRSRLVAAQLLYWF